MGLLKRIVGAAFNVCLIAAIILFTPGLPPYGDMKAIHLSPTKPLTGVLAPNGYVLNQEEKLFEGDLNSPEGLELSPVHPDVFYTALLGGSIVKIYDNGRKMDVVAKTSNNNCRGPWDLKNCGWPLGLRFNKNGNLNVADGFLGIFEINVDTGEKTLLVPKDDIVDGKPAKLFNSVAPAKDGKIYYTVSSTDYALDGSIGVLWGPPSGRLMVYDPITRKSKVLQESVHAANGVILSAEEDYIVFSELAQYRLLKHHIKGPKAGTTEVFLDGLPGCPDNLSHSPDGNIMVALVLLRNTPDQFDVVEFTYSHPWLRKFILRVLHLIKMPIEFAAGYLDTPFIHQLNSLVFSFLDSQKFIPPGSIILEVSWSGKILKSWHSSTPGRTISEAQIFNDYMYLGSPFNNFLGRIKMPSSKASSS